MTRLRWNAETGEYRPVKGEAILEFVAFSSPQVTKSAAARCGAHRAGGMTHFTSERQLRTYMANEKSAGRDVRWKDHAHGD